MFIMFFKTLLIFSRTLYYLLLSYRKNADLTELKQKWAKSILSALDLHLRVINKYSAQENLIFVGNHIGFLDIIVLIAVEPRLVFLSKAEVSHWPIIGAGARRIGTLFVNRESPASRAKSKQAIYNRLKCVEKQTYIAGFPSGTSCLFEDKPWKKGLFEIAMNTETHVQSFKLKYSPLRACAYIDNDTLFTSLMNLFNTKNKVVLLEWGTSQQITDLNEQITRIQKWTQTQFDINEEKTFIRPSYSLEFQ